MNGRDPVHPDLTHPVGPRSELTPQAPQGPSDAQLNAIPPDPVLPPFGGSTSLFFDLIAGTSMLTDKATSMIQINRRR
jgi:hypothetical protein